MPDLRKELLVVLVSITTSCTNLMASRTGKKCLKTECLLEEKEPMTPAISITLGHPISQCAPNHCANLKQNVF